MIIEENIKGITFEELEYGDIFRYGSVYYMKLPPCTIENGYNYTSFDLVNNDYCFFSDYRDVYPAKAKLVIEKN